MTLGGTPQIWCIVVAKYMGTALEKIDVCGHYRFDRCLKVFSSHRFVLTSLKAILKMGKFKWMILFLKSQLRTVSPSLNQSLRNVPLHVLLIQLEKCSSLVGMILYTTLLFHPPASSVVRTVDSLKVFWAPSFYVVPFDKKNDQKWKPISLLCKRLSWCLLLWCKWLDDTWGGEISIYIYQINAVCWNLSCQWTGYLFIPVFSAYW